MGSTERHKEPLLSYSFNIGAYICAAYYVVPKKQEFEMEKEAQQKKRKPVISQ